MCADNVRPNEPGDEKPTDLPSGPVSAVERLLPDELRAALPSNVAAQTVAVFTRHGESCPKHARHYSRPAEKRAAKFCRTCRCPKWLYVFHDGADFRFSAHTRSWERAEALAQQVRDLLDPVKNELRQLKEKHASRITIPYAANRYLDDIATRNLAKVSLKKVARLCKRLVNWAEGKRLRYLDELDVDKLGQWRDSWKLAPLTKQKAQEQVRTFFRFCVQRGWIVQNPAVFLSRIRVDRAPTDYFPPNEFKQVVLATYRLGAVPKLKTAAERLRTLLLLMRWSGLRIGDAVTLPRIALKGDNLSLYQQKTAAPVFIPLPSAVAELLRKVPVGQTSSPLFFFWNGRSRLSAIEYWSRLFRRLFVLADIRHEDGTPKRCYPHMLRDTFAVESLLAGISIEQVSKLLGHASIKTTEKHYLPWVRARQQQLIQVVQGSWPVGGIVIPAPQICIPDKKTAEEQALDRACAGSERERTNNPAQYGSVQAQPPAGSDQLRTEGAPQGTRPDGCTGIEHDSVTRRKRVRVPYELIHRMWNEGKTLMEIAQAMGRVTPGKDPTHAIRRLTTRMHQSGYVDSTGQRVKLPYRTRPRRFRTAS